MNLNEVVLQDIDKIVTKYKIEEKELKTLKDIIEKLKNKYITIPELLDLTENIYFLSPYPSWPKAEYKKLLEE